MGRVKEYVDGSGIYLVTKIKNRNKCATWQISDLCAKILQKFRLAANGSYLTRKTVFKLRSNKLIDTKGHKKQFDIETVVDEEDIAQNISNEEQKLYKFLLENDGNITYDLLSRQNTPNQSIDDSYQISTTTKIGTTLSNKKWQYVINKLGNWLSSESDSFSEAILRHFIWGNVLTVKKCYITPEIESKCQNLLFHLYCHKCNKVFSNQSELAKHFLREHTDVVNNCIRKYFLYFLTHSLRYNKTHAQKFYIKIINIKMALKNHTSLDLYECLAENKHLSEIEYFINTFYEKKIQQEENNLAIINLNKMFRYLENGCYSKSLLFRKAYNIAESTDN